MKWIASLSILVWTNLALTGTADAGMVLEYGHKGTGYSLSTRYLVTGFGPHYRISSQAGGTVLGQYFGIDQTSVVRKGDFTPLFTTTCEQAPDRDKEKCRSYKFLGNGIYLVQKHDGVKKSISEVRRITKKSPGTKRIDAAKKGPFRPGTHVLHHSSTLLLSAMTLGLSPAKPTHTTYVVNGEKVRKIVFNYRKTLNGGRYEIGMDVSEGKRKNIPTQVVIDPDYNSTGRAVIVEIHGRRPKRYMAPLTKASGLDLLRP